MPSAKCSKCGRVIPAEAEWCPHCGKTPTGLKIRHFLFILGALILLGLLIAGVVMK